MPDQLALKVRVKSVFGRDAIYPANAAAEALAAIAGTITLQPSVLRIARDQLGATLEVDEKDNETVIELMRRGA